MCYQTKITKKKEKLEDFFNAKLIGLEDFIPNEVFNAFSYPKTPVITVENQKQIQLFNWGLVPSWADNSWNKNFTLNARIETLDQKKSFSNIMNNRCLVIVNGFYEWKHINKQKIKYEIGFNNQLFVLAGLFDTNENNNTYTIITAEAKGVMKEIHNTKLRMPFAIQNKKEMFGWLNGEPINPNYNFTAFPSENHQTFLDGFF